MNQTIKLDAKKREGSFCEEKIYPLRRGERNNVVLTVQVRADGAPYDLTGKTASLVATTAAGKLVGPCQMQVAEAGIARIMLPAALYSAVGSFSGYVEIREGETLVDTTDSFGGKVIECADLDTEQAAEFTPLLGELQDAIAAARASEVMGATAVTLETGNPATATFRDNIIEIGVPKGERGAKGDRGEKGDKGEPGSDAPATDVRIAGKSITADGVANIPLASTTQEGVTKYDPYGGLSNGERGWVVTSASNGQIDARSASHFAITADSQLDYAVKAAMCDGKGAAWTADEQKAARERMNAADANKVYIMQKQIENLQGIAATEETDSTEAYTKTVPTGAQKWASLDKVGGKTVVWNQLNNIPNGSTGLEHGITATINGNIITYNGTPTDGTYIDVYSDISNCVKNSIVVGHKYLVFVNDTNKASADGNQYDRITYLVENFSGYTEINGGYGYIITATEVPSYYFVRIQLSNHIGERISGKASVDLIDLTQMFGAGDDPTSMDDPRIAFIKAYAEEHPEYNPGELMSAEVVEVESKGTFTIPDEVREMCPGYGWSSGTGQLLAGKRVFENVLDFASRKYEQKVVKADADTSGWLVGSGAPNDNGIAYLILNTGNAITGISDASKYISSNIEVQDILWSESSNDGFAYNGSTLFFRFKATAETAKLVDGLARMRELDAKCYYPIDNPIEVDLSDVLPDDHFIEVEAGGTVTFKQASTQLPVPSEITYQISTKEVVANA